jgi:hypothetical protein
MTIIETLAKKYAALSPALSERGRRLWAGTEADAIGRGGVAWVAAASGLAISTVRKGRDETRSADKPELVRDRRPGGGRPRLEKKDPMLLSALETLVNGSARGDPESPLRWTCKSLRLLAREMARGDHRASPTKIGQLLRRAGFSLQANAKTKEGADHPDRNAQFELINLKAQDFMGRGLPVISVDSKKKETIGEHANNGREWQPRGQAIEVLSHEFIDSTSPQAIPYGIYDVAKNTGFVNVGTDHNTASFAVRSVEKWWEQMGSLRYPNADELFITADAGGSNASKSRVWKLKLQEVADRTGLKIHVSHFPPGTSKWNKIEHRLFSFISINWRGRPLTTYETVVQLIAATTTSRGLKVHAQLDMTKYPLGVSASDGAMNALLLDRAKFHGEWNYTLLPRSAEQRAAAPEEPKGGRRGTNAEARARWLKLIGEQHRSGLGHRAFCRARGLNYSSYNTMRHTLMGRIHKRGRPNK